MNALDLLILAAATAYVAFVVTSKDGPFRVFARLRAALPLGGLMACVWCLAVWVAAALYLAWISVVLQPVVIILAIAGIALMLASYSGVQHV